jgi:hypothetical protein
MSARKAQVSESAGQQVSEPATGGCAIAVPDFRKEKTGNVDQLPS